MVAETKGAKKGAHGTGKDGDRVPSGIPGLDDLIGGGFERGSTTLIMGGPGTGKTTLLAQFLYNGAVEHGEPGVMLSFEESGKSISHHMEKFGFDFKTLEEEEMFASINYRPHEVKKLVEEGGGLIWDTVSSIGAKRLAIDSLTSYAVMFETTYQAREGELILFDLFQKWGCTTLLSADAADKGKRGENPASISDEVLMLYHPRNKASRYRAIEVLKARGTKHSEKLCPFEFVEGVGIKVYPSQNVFYEVEKKK